MVFSELARFEIFGEWFSANCHVGESFANGFSRTDTLANLWRIFVEWFLGNWDVCEYLANLCGMVFGELTRLRIFGESLGNGFWRTDTLANHWRNFGEWYLAKWHVGESFTNLWGIVFGELTRCQIFGKSLGNGFLGNDTVENLWRMFGEWFLANWHVGESLGNLWRMVFSELTCFEIFGEWFSANWHVGESLANGFSRSDTLANLWRIFVEWFLGNWHVGESLANV